MKILCIQLKQIGDVLMTTPAVKALALFYPQAEIHFLTQKPADQIFIDNPHIQKILTLPSRPNNIDLIKIFLKLRRENYTIVIDFFGQGKTAFMSWFSKAPTRIGYNFRGRNKFYTNPCDIPADLHYAVIHKLYLLKELGINSSAIELDFYISQQDREQVNTLLKYDEQRLLISVSPVSRRSYKVWPVERFAIICDQLIEKKNAQIVFIYGPGEEKFIDDVKKCMKFSDDLISLDRILSLRESVALFEKVDLHFGNDNGLMHCAIAAKVPTIAIFGRPIAKNWSPPDHPWHWVIEHDPGCKFQCHYPKCALDCLNKITVEFVWNTLRNMLIRIQQKHQSPSLFH